MLDGLPKSDGFLVFAFLIAGAIYFTPTIVADLRKHRNKIGIFLLNIFLGWTLIGWVAALIWAVWEEKN